MLAELTLLVLAFLIAIVIFKIVKKLWVMFASSILAIIGLFLLNIIFGLGIAINIWSVLIVALGGLPGLVLVILLKILGIAF